MPTQNLNKTWRKKNWTLGILFHLVCPLATDIHCRGRTIFPGAISLSEFCHHVFQSDVILIRKNHVSEKKKKILTPRKNSLAAAVIYILEDIR